MIGNKIVLSYFFWMETETPKARRWKGPCNIKNIVNLTILSILESLTPSLKLFLLDGDGNSKSSDMERSL